MFYRRTVLHGLEYRVDHLDRAGTITPLLKAQPGSTFPHSPSGREDVFSETAKTTACRLFPPVGRSVRNYRYRVVLLSIIISIVQRRAGRKTAVLTKNEAEYVSTREAALLLGVSQRAVCNLAGQQRLEVKTEGGDAATRFMASVQRLRLKRQR